MALADPVLSQMNCLLIDIELFGIDGFELRDRLRDRGSMIPYIFITAHSISDVPEWHVRMGESIYLTKPIEGRLLLSAIDSLTLKKHIVTDSEMW